MPKSPPRRTDRGRRLRRATVLGAASLTALATLAACGPTGSSASGPAVASLPTTAASASSSGPAATGSSTGDAGSPATDATAGRPQERLDDSPAKTEAIIHVWDKCLLANGAKSGGPGPLNASPEDSLQEPLPASAIKACMSKEPIGPPQLDPDLNPDYHADSVAEVKCLQAHGDKVHMVADTSDNPNGLTWTYDDDAQPIANEPQVANDCELAAFVGKGQ